MWTTFCRKVVLYTDEPNYQILQIRLNVKLLKATGNVLQLLPKALLRPIKAKQPHKCIWPQQGWEWRVFKFSILSHTVAAASLEVRMGGEGISPPSGHDRAVHHHVWRGGKKNSPFSSLGNCGWEWEITTHPSWLVSRVGENTPIFSREAENLPASPELRMWHFPHPPDTTELWRVGGRKSPLLGHRKAAENGGYSPHSILQTWQSCDPMMSGELGGIPPFYPCQSHM